MRPKFTPGVWETVDQPSLETPQIEIYEGGTEYLIGILFAEGSGDYKANARLIVAAPEMYKLLKQCASHIGGHDKLAHAVDALFERIEGK